MDKTLKNVSFGDNNKKPLHDQTQHGRTSKADNNAQPQSQKAWGDSEAVVSSDQMDCEKRGLASTNKDTMRKHML